MMKTTLLPALIFLSLVFFGCSRHQYVYVETQEEHANTFEHLTQDDSIAVWYDFSGRNIPVKITIENRSDKPLYIDWKKSVAVIDGQKYNYWHDDASIQFEGFSDFYMFFSADGSIVKDERITFIPPRSYIESTRLFLQTVLFQELPEHHHRRVKMYSAGGPVSAKRYEFSELDSPLSFRSILAFSDHESFRQESFMENTFWVSKIIESSSNTLFGLQPNYEDGIRNMPNTSIISTKTAFGRTVGTIGVIGLSTGLIYLGSMLDPE